MLITIKELKQIFHNHYDQSDDSLTIERITTDSRVAQEQSLFVPIVGENFNGHDYVEQAIENGAIAIIWDEKEELPASIPHHFPVFFTQDTTQGLQQLAKYYREKVDPIVIGITGSNGKTTTKDLVTSIMKTTYRTHATAGNLNNHIGLPLTILDMPSNTEVLVLEMGMSGFGEIDLLTKIAMPDYAIITNIGESHIEFLGSREGIAKAKLEIVNGLKEKGTLITDGDEPFMRDLHIDKDFRVIYCGFGEENDVQITGTEISPEGTSFSLSDGTNFHIPLFGKHHAKNAAFALHIGNLFHIPVEKQREGIKSLAYTSMRFEMLQARNGAKVVNDTYNASPTSMKGAIEVIKQMDGFSRRILVLGDILELGGFSDEMHRSIAEVITPPITHLYTYGEKAKLITEKVEKNIETIHSRHFTTKEELAEALLGQLTQDTLILFKASRGLQFETMVEKLLVDENTRSSD